MAVTSTSAPPRTALQSATTTGDNTGVRSNSPIGRTSPPRGNDTSPLRPRNSANPTALGEPKPEPGSQAALWKEYPTEEDWAAKVAQQRIDAISSRPRVNISDAQRSAERGKLVPRSERLHGRFVAEQNRFKDQIPSLQTSNGVMCMLGIPDSASAHATGLHSLPEDLRAEPLGLLTERFLSISLNEYQTEREYGRKISALAAAADKIPVYQRHAAITRVQQINHGYNILPSLANRVDTPDQFTEFLGTARANRGEPIGIQALPSDLRARSLVGLGMRIHRMQGESVPRAELTRQLLAAIGQLPIADRNSDIFTIERIATASLSSPSRPTRSPVDLVLAGVARPEHIASFYNIDLNTLNVQVAARLSLAGANPN
jgi:hypothetical protein